MIVSLLSLLAPCIPADSPADLLRERGGRPDLSGPVSSEQSEDGRFTVHWTDEGEDAPPVLDADANGRSDYLDRVFGALSLGGSVYEELGFRAVPPDDGSGGDGSLDLYVKVLPVNGYANPVVGPEGMSCFMQIDPGLGSGGAILESVVVHELHHCVQYTYTVEAQSWIYEAGATYEQYDHVQSPTLQVALDVLWNDRLRGADRPLDEADGRFEYAGFLFVKFIEERGETDRARIPRLWQALEAEPVWQEGLGALAGAEWGLDLGELLLDFHTWNAFACSRDDGAHYGSERHPCTFPATSVNVQVLAAELDHAFEAGGGSAFYAELEAEEDRPVELRCSQEVEAAAAWVRLVALDVEGASGEEASARIESEGSLRLEDPLDPRGAVLVVVVAEGAEAPRLRCDVARVDPISDPPPEPPPEGEACACSSASRAGVLPLFGAVIAGRLRRTRRGAREGAL